MNQSILIGDDIKITILRLDRGQVGIGIAAPDNVKIIREEIVGTPPNDGRNP